LGVETKTKYKRKARLSGICKAALNIAEFLILPNKIEKLGRDESSQYYFNKNYELSR
jgi:hypothetical protein